MKIIKRSMSAHRFVTWLRQDSKFSEKSLKTTILVIDGWHLCGFPTRPVALKGWTHPSGKKALMILSPRGLMANSGILWKSSRLDKDKNTFGQRSTTRTLQRQKLWSFRKHPAGIWALVVGNAPRHRQNSVDSNNWRWLQKNLLFLLVSLSPAYPHQRQQKPSGSLFNKMKTWTRGPTSARTRSVPAGRSVFPQLL